jgi:hypothetical protein
MSFPFAPRAIAAGSLAAALSLAGLGGVDQAAASERPPSASPGTVWVATGFTIAETSLAPPEGPVTIEGRWEPPATEEPRADTPMGPRATVILEARAARQLWIRTAAEAEEAVAKARAERKAARKAERDAAVAAWVEAAEAAEEAAENARAERKAKRVAAREEAREAWIAAAQAAEDASADAAEAAAAEAGLERTPQDEEEARQRRLRRAEALRGEAAEHAEQSHEKIRIQAEEDAAEAEERALRRAERRRAARDAARAEREAAGSDEAVVVTAEPVAPPPVQACDELRGEDVPRLVADIFRCHLRDAGYSRGETRRVAAEAVVIAQCESLFDPNAIVFNGRYLHERHPRTGYFYSAAGVFQFIRDTANKWIVGGYDNVLDPTANIDAAARLYLANRSLGLGGWEDWACAAANDGFKATSVLPGWPGGPAELPDWAWSY